jgi:predicted DNA-binding transcriptional regulator YafY
MKSPKIQRWIDLLAALLSRRLPATFEELIRDVPAYAAGGQSPETRRRMFERDKDELRANGIPIETVDPPDEGDAQGYQLRTRDFYLPYLALRAEGRTKAPRKSDRYGYRSLPTLTFEAEELAAIAEAAARLRDLGDPLMAEHAESAMRKLACDLPLDAAAAPSARMAHPRSRPAPEVFATAGEALRDRKRLTFTYHTMGSDAVGERTVEPFGLFFLSQHWYLAARTPGEETVKNYRLSRVTGARPNPRQPGTPDYEIPSGFDLQQHARSREAWELGSGDAVVATIALRSPSGAAVAAHRLGEAVDGDDALRRFRVRRVDTFARWLLSFAGDLEPVSPAQVVEEYKGLVRETLAHHA